MKRILLADNNRDLRSALRLLLKTRFGLNDIFEAGDVENLVRQLKETNPDCLILDWELPGCPDCEQISLLRSLVPGLKIMVLSLRSEVKQDALEAGVEAFVCKAESPTVMLEGIRQLCQAGEGQVNLDS